MSTHADSSVTTPTMSAEELLGLPRVLTMEEYRLLSNIPRHYTGLDVDGNVYEFGSAQAKNREDEHPRRLSNFFRTKFGLTVPRNADFLPAYCGRVDDAYELVEGVAWFQTVEQFYQAELFRLASIIHHSRLEDVSKEIQQARGAEKAKKIAKDNLDQVPCAMCRIWHDQELKVGVMRFALWKKFNHFEVLHNAKAGKENKTEVLKTGDKYVREVCTKHKDEYWGVTKGVGENMLGRLFMSMREQMA